MKLIDQIIEVDEEKTVSITTVTEKWPSFENGSVNPAIMVELVAQTTSFGEGWRAREKRDDGGRGWLVGIKSAEFFVSEISVNTKLTVTVRGKYSVSEKYQVSEGTVADGGKILGEITIQVFRP